MYLGVWKIWECKNIIFRLDDINTNEIFYLIEVNAWTWIINKITKVKTFIFKMVHKSNLVHKIHREGSRRGR